MAGLNLAWISVRGSFSMVLEVTLMRGAIWTFTKSIYPLLFLAADKHSLIPSKTPITLENDDVYPTQRRNLVLDAPSGFCQPVRKRLGFWCVSVITHQRGQVERHR